MRRSTQIRIPGPSFSRKKIAIAANEIPKAIEARALIPETIPWTSVEVVCELAFATLPVALEAPAEFTPRRFSQLWACGIAASACDRIASP